MCDHAPMNICTTQNGIFQDRGGGGHEGNGVDVGRQGGEHDRAHDVISQIINLKKERNKEERTGNLVDVCSVQLSLQSF